MHRPTCTFILTVSAARQRIRGAIDRTIAEEQARQKTLDSETPSRSASTSSRRSDSNATGRRSRSKKASFDVTDPALPNTDPAVFEAAFVIDDSDEPSRSGTPGLPPQEKGELGTETTSVATQEGLAEKVEHNGTLNHKVNGGESVQSDNGAPHAPHAPTTDLSSDVKQRLRKLEKLEATYPGKSRWLRQLLRSYRVAHRRATAIEPFEKALRENTPLTSIGDPSALIEYLNQLKLRGDMVMEELKKVSADKDEMKRRYEEAEEKLKESHAATEATKTGVAPDSTAAEEPAKKQNHVESTSRKSTDVAPEKAKSPVASVIGMFSPKQKAQDQATLEPAAGEDFFSYDEEIPQLQAEAKSSKEEIQRLTGKVEDLKKELSVAKENSAGLAEHLEKTTQELSESRELAASSESLLSQLDERSRQVETLTGKLDAAQTRLRELQEQRDGDQTVHATKIGDIEAALARSDKKASDLDGEISRANVAKEISKKLVDDLSNQIEGLKKEKLESLARIEDLTKQLASAAPREPVAEPPSVSNGTASAPKGKKNKKKKGKAAGGSGAAAAVVEEVDNASQVEVASTPVQGQLEAQISQLRADVEAKDKEIEMLSKKRKTEDDLREEIETLQENLLHIGQDHVEAKQRIKALEEEKAKMEEDISELQGKLGSSDVNSTANATLQHSMDALQKEFDDLKDKTATLQSDLGASQQLAQTRFKDLTDLRDVLEKAQPELKSLRQEAAELKKTKEELSTKMREMKGLERKETELKRDAIKAQQLAMDREQEIKSLQEKLKVEATSRQKAEDGKRSAERDVRRAEAEKIELSAKAEKTERELQKTHDELEKLRPRVKELEEQMHKLRRDKAASQEEAEFKSQQYTNAQSLLTNMRDQAADMSVQLKEVQSQSESLEEELGEVQRLLQERTREGETMRRLLADVDERAESKVREMRARMDAAIEERERIEDESSTLARRKARECEELKSKIRELERDVKSLTNEKDDLEERQREWKRRRDELEAVETKASAETEEMRSTVSQLRTALDTCETQLRDGEKQRGELRRMLDDSRSRYEKTAKDLKSAQLKLTAAGASRRSSTESARSGSGSGGGGGGGGVGDVMYIRTILLQFLEQKDGKLRAQLIPVLAKLLKFDKQCNTLKSNEQAPRGARWHGTAAADVVLLGSRPWRARQRDDREPAAGPVCSSVPTRPNSTLNTQQKEPATEWSRRGCTNPVPLTATSGPGVVSVWSLRRPASVTRSNPDEALAGIPAARHAPNYKKVGLGPQPIDTCPSPPDRILPSSGQTGP
ncbi:grip [Moelleriella libera RCEF 2490]|uniref:Grip n=1 Tax=Moelleriella libera RCEF 2490 TaxID=1081109 RepID=A0A167W6M5_9HYPO|nr:grip [Moelleriella libera RCEF 2490]